MISPDDDTLSTADELARIHAARAAYQRGRTEGTDPGERPHAHVAARENAEASYVVAYLARALALHAPHLADVVARELATTLKDGPEEWITEWLAGYGVDGPELYRQGRAAAVSESAPPLGWTASGVMTSVLGLAAPASFVAMVWTGDGRWGYTALVLLLVAGVFGVLYNNRLERSRNR